MQTNTLIPKLDIFIYKKFDIQATLYLFFEQKDFTNLDTRIKNLNLPPPKATKFKQAVLNNNKNSALNILDTIYTQRANKLETAKNTLRSFNNTCNNKFFKFTTEFFANINWAYPEYKVLISAFRSFASWGGDTVAIMYRHIPQNIHILYFELLVTKVFEIKNKLMPKLADTKTWAIAEVLAGYTLYKHPYLQKQCFPYLQNKHFRVSTFYSQLKNLEEYVYQYLDRTKTKAESGISLKELKHLLNVANN